MAGSAGAAPPEARFPVTIEHRHGSTEIGEPPERVVTVGYTDHDTVLALGVEPVAVREWYGGHPHATWPWAVDELGDAAPEVLPSGELDFEQIAALRPDLILGIYSGLTVEEYETLSAIAPTVAQSADHADYTTPWQEMARTIGRALGRGRQVEELIADIQDRFAAEREAHPHWAELQAVAAYSFEPGTYGVYGPGDPRTDFLAALGFGFPAEVAAALPEDQFFGTISGEQLELLDHDLLVWFTLTDAERPALEALGVYQALEVAAEGRDIFLGGDTTLSGALSFSSVLSLPYALDELVPRIEAAVDGDPDTAVEEAP
ncbi:MAG TPA: iron-siderophore ABC transporter substrate-binding protein [candidate division Zixibacteria bacterium]|nr:iron-siderophore ABC transporter substrate-binding protein [candidate division Zixibacteria bacterium]